MEKRTPATYIIIGTVLFLLLIIHVFGIVPIATDKFSIFLISLFTAVMLIPLLKYLKFFDLVELRRTSRLQRQKR